MTDLPHPPPTAAPRSPYTGRRTRFSSQHQAFPNSIEGSMASWVPMSPEPSTAALTRDDVKAESSFPRHQSTSSWKPVRMSVVSPRTKAEPPRITSVATMESWNRPSGQGGGDIVFERSNPFDIEHQAATTPQTSMQLLSRPPSAGVSESGYSKSSWTGSNGGLATVPHTTMSANRTHSPAEWEKSSGDGQWPRPMSQWQGKGVKPVKMLPTTTSSSGSASGSLSPMPEPVPRKGITVQLPPIMEKQRSRTGTTRTNGSRPTVNISVERRFILFNLYLIFRPYLTSIAAIIAAVIIMLAMQRTNSPLSAMFIARPGDFLTTRLPLSAFLAENIAFGFSGYCLPSGVCYNYGGSEFNSKTGIWLPENSLFTTAEGMYAALGAIACLYAAFHSFTAFIQIYLLKSLHLPLGFLTDRQRNKAEAQLEMISNECNMSALFWTWWAHAKSPLGPFLALLMAATAIMAFGLTTGFRSALGGDSTLGTGAYMPLAALVLIFDPLCHAAMYLGSVNTNFTTFCNGPSFSNATPTSATPAKASHSTVSSNEKSNRTTATTQKSSVPSSDATRRTMKSVVPGWTKRMKRKDDDRRRSSGTSFFNTAERRPTITSAELHAGVTFDTPEVPPMPPIPGTHPAMPLATPSQATFRTGSRATSILTKKALADQMAASAAVALTKTPDVEALQPHRLSTIDSQTEHTEEPTVDGLSVGGSMLSSNSYDSARWLQDYKASPALANIMYRLNAGQAYEPYILSDDGLLYNYIPDPEGKPDLEVPRLVPPEGPIRLELIDDAVDEVGADGGRMAQWKAVMESLSSKYWWEEMLEDVEAYLGHYS